MKSNSADLSETSRNLIGRDRAAVWHPLTQHGKTPQILGIDSAKGIYLYDVEGRAYIDAISSWYTCVYGHCHPEITGAVSQQMQRLDQVVFAGLTHEPAVALSEKLLEVLPANQARIFYSDNGSTATEVGIKMALQFHFNRGEKRPVLLAFEEGFHGDTFGAMSVSGLEVYNGPFSDFNLEVRRIPVPKDAHPEKAISTIASLGEQGLLAGFIYEPLVQGAAAMKMHNAHGLESILKAVKAAGGLLIADEIMTGFGKTETCFASEQLPTKPDIICLSKALTAGLLPMGATSCSQEVFDAFYSEEIAKGFFHGHTYTANPLSCTAALAALKLYETAEIQEGRKRISEAHTRFGEHISGHSAVRSIRQRGVIFALDLEVSTQRYGSLRDKLYQFYLDAGVYLRPLGNTIYFLPPYITPQAALDKLYTTTENLLDSF